MSSMMLCQMEGKAAQNIYKIISTRLLLLKVDFCSVLCDAKMPILRAFWHMGDFIRCCLSSSNSSQMV